MQTSTLNKIQSLPPHSQAVFKEAVKLWQIRRNPSLAIPRFMKVRKGEFFVMGKIHLEWQAHLTKHQYALIIAPRDHGKSEQVAVARTLVEIAKDPTIRIGLFSGSKTQARKRVKAVKRHIEFNKDYQRLYPWVIPDKDNVWTGEQIAVKNDTIDKEPTLEAIGRDSIYTGDRKDLIISDDIVPREAMSSATIRKSIEESFDNDIEMLLEPEGRLWYIATLWHIADLTHRLMRELKTNGYGLLFQAIDEHCNPIWPEKWTKEALEKRRGKNLIAYNRGFRNIPLSDEFALFQREWVSSCIREAEADSIPELIREIVTSKWIIYGGVDLAISKKTTADFTVIFIMAYDPDTRIKIPLEIVRGHYSSPETAKLIMTMNGKWKPSMFMVENVSYQESIIQWIDEMKSWDLGWSFPTIEGFLTGKQKADEFVGLPSVAAEFNNNSWIIYNHTNPLKNGAASCSCSTCTWIDEMTTFPIGGHDDTIMASWFAREAARKDSMGGVGFV